MPHWRQTANQYNRNFKMLIYKLIKYKCYHMSVRDFVVPCASRAYMEFMNYVPVYIPDKI